MSDNEKIVCMCGKEVDSDEVVWIHPATKAITWTEGLPFCENCVPVDKEDL